MECAAPAYVPFHACYALYHFARVIEHNPKPGWALERRPGIKWD